MSVVCNNKEDAQKKEKKLMVYRKQKQQAGVNLFRYSVILIELQQSIPVQIAWFISPFISLLTDWEIA